MTRIKAESGSSLEEAFVQFLMDTLPARWELERSSAGPPQGDRGYDLVITGPDGNQVFVVVKTPPHVTPASVPRTADQLRRSREALEDQAASVATVLISNFVSRRSRELLEAAGVGWYDLTGNVKVEAERPSLFIHQSGADQDPNPDTNGRRQKSLRGPGAARVVRALLDGAPDTRVRALAEHAGVGAGTSARVLAYLAQENLVERDKRASVRRIHKRSLAHAWARDYGLTRTNHATTVLAPRGLDWVVERLAERNLPHVLAGSAALRYYLPDETAAATPLSLLALYSNEVPRLKRELRLRETGRGANAILLEPFDPVIVGRIREDETHRYTAPSQTVVDLLTSPGRGPEEADQLIEVLAAQDEEWTF